MGAISKKKKYDRVNAFKEVIKALFQWRNRTRFLYKNGDRMYCMKQPAGGGRWLVTFLDFDPNTGSIAKPVLLPAKAIRRAATNLKGQPLWPDLIL